MLSILRLMPCDKTTEWMYSNYEIIFLNLKSNAVGCQPNFQKKSVSQTPSYFLFISEFILEMRVWDKYFRYNPTLHCLPW